MDRAVFPRPICRLGAGVTTRPRLAIVFLFQRFHRLMTESATTSTATITVNGEERTVSPRYPLIDLLQDLDIAPGEASGIAVAINESVIRQSDWDDATLADGDTVEVITAQQGG